ncbi:hypothetical protein L2E82_30294 [Cichorium intybus]|uniref:Uncharacterized protein n=1 Tax=Cichorium intybus TaxID=13427 RepID=A0ACB9CZW0_CICIN|nr:hypothetical protein L2E82_30294 [Cichorium intybus]
MCGFVLSSSSTATIRGLVAATTILLELGVFTLSRFNDLPTRREVSWGAVSVLGFLSDGQEKRLAKDIESIEKDTGFKLRVVAQNYPDTPGLSIKDLWQLDDRTIVFVANPTFGKVSISDILHPLLL